MRISFTVGTLRVQSGVWWGSAPGTHKGVWVTNMWGLKGINVRIGSLNKNVTATLHWRHVDE